MLFTKMGKPGRGTYLRKNYQELVRNKLSLMSSRQFDNWSAVGWFGLEIDSWELSFKNGM